MHSPMRGVNVARGVHDNMPCRCRMQWREESVATSASGGHTVYSRRRPEPGRMTWCARGSSACFRKLMATMTKSSAASSARGQEGRYTGQKTLNLAKTAFF